MVAPAALKTVGVEAVVESLGTFLSDVGTMNKSIGSIGEQGNLLTRVLDGVGGAFSWLGNRIVDVATYALGQLLASAIEAVISRIREMIGAILEAGAEFQILELRLNRLNFNDVAGDVGDFNEAMGIATEMTQDQLEWVQKLAVTTPYDAQDIANVFTLARSYDFASEAAKGLTQDIANFAAGMGLGNVEIVRIIKNFGQMVQLGKVTQRELNDLAVGAFVPVNKILARMQENVGMTDAAFKDFRSTGEGVNAFLTAFSQVVAETSAGAAQDMARTFQGATANAQDFLKSLLGFNIVRPVLDQLGGGIADALNQLTAEGNWERLNDAAARVGEAFGLVLRMLQHILGLNVGGFADGLIDGLNGIADWIDSHRTDIYMFFVGIRDKVLNLWDALKNRDFEGFLKALGLDQGVIDKVVEFRDGVIEAFDIITSWVDENGETISKFFETLGEIVGGVFENLTGGAGEGMGGGLESLLAGVGKFMQYIIDNKESITDFITKLVGLWAVLQVVGFVLGIVSGVVMTFIGFLLSVAAVIATVIAVVFFLLSPIGLLALAIVALGAVIAIFGADAAAYFEYLKERIVTYFEEVGVTLQVWWGNVILGFQTTWAAIQVWFGNVQLGFATVQQVIIDWVTSVAASLTEFVTSGIQRFQEFVTKGLELFTGFKDQFLALITQIKKIVTDAPWGTIGRNIIHGMATGVMHAVQGLIDAVVGAIRAAIAAAYEALDASSPSKVFMELGEGTMQGMAIGIRNMAGLAKRSMESAIGGITMPAVMQQYALAPSTVSNQNSYTNNFNLTVNSQSQTEPILQDYNMMKSVIGAG